MWKQSKKTTKKTQNQKMYSIHSINRRCPVTAEEGGPQYRWELPCKTNALITNAPIAVPFSLSMISQGMEYLFDQIGSAVSAMHPPKPLPTLNLLPFDAVFGEGALVLCRHCSAAASRLVWYQHLSSYKHKAPQHCMGC